MLHEKMASGDVTFQLRLDGFNQISRFRYYNIGAISDYLKRFDKFHIFSVFSCAALLGEEKNQECTQKKRV